MGSGSRCVDSPRFIILLVGHHVHYTALPLTQNLLHTGITLINLTKEPTSHRVLFVFYLNYTPGGRPHFVLFIIVSMCVVGGAHACV